MSLLPIITATAMATCPHLPAEARATYTPSTDLYGIYELIIAEELAYFGFLARELGQNVSAEDAMCSALPPETDP